MNATGSQWPVAIPRPTLGIALLSALNFEVLCELKSCKWCCAAALCRLAGMVEVCCWFWEFGCCNCWGLFASRCAGVSNEGAADASWCDMFAAAVNYIFFLSKQFLAAETIIQVRKYGAIQMLGCFKCKKSRGLSFHHSHMFDDRCTCRFWPFSLVPGTVVVTLEGLKSLKTEVMSEENGGKRRPRASKG